MLRDIDTAEFHLQEAADLISTIVWMHVEWCVASACTRIVFVYQSLDIALQSANTAPERMQIWHVITLF